MLANPKRHVVVEANPGLLETLQRNKDLNRAEFTIVSAAVGVPGPTFDFPVPNHFLMGGQTGDGNCRKVKVPVLTLESVSGILERTRLVLVCDIEGAESGLIELESEFIRDNIELVIIELHPSITGKVKVEQMMARMHSLGLESIDSFRDVVVLRRAKPAASS
jgi:FkbM family methyltransferase